MSFEFREFHQRETLTWPIFNQDRELIAAHLINSFGAGLYQAIEPHWQYGLREMASAVPINHVLRFRTYGRRMKIRREVENDYRWRVVSERGADGAIKRAHLHVMATMRDGDSDVPAGDGEFWMAMTRPLMPPGERQITAIPASLHDMVEHALRPDDLPAVPLDQYAVAKPAGEGHGVWASGEQPHIFHIDRTDLNHHVNTVVYMQLGLDAIARVYDEWFGNAGKLRFRDLTIHFRKPFGPGDAARITSEILVRGDRFRAAARFYPRVAEGAAPPKASTAMVVEGPVL